LLYSLFVSALAKRLVGKALISFRI